jgi:poly-gamma-glutamate synthesis protein (capsule biosynthesis protein)
VRRALSALRASDPDLVVACLHWGPNWVTRPARGQRAFAQWLVERGVDVVHGHSAHVIQGVETHRGRPILYDCGDFVDDYLFKKGLHNKRSFLFELAVSGGTPDALRLVPVQIYDESVHPAGGSEAAWLRERLRTLSSRFGTTVERAGDGLSIPLSDC